MMAFRPARGGYEARATEDERTMLASLARDLVLIMGSDIRREVERREEVEQRPSDPEADLFDALELELAGVEEAAHSAVDVGPSSYEDGLPVDPAMEALFPDMSENPESAHTLRSLTEDSIAGAKIENLTTFYMQLRAIETPQNPGATAMGIGDRVWVSNEDAPSWLASLNDIRLVLATRLEIDSDEAATEIFERAGMFTTQYSRLTDNVPEVETPEDMMAVLYAMATWWQESLVASVRSKEARR
ncbi:DUF2017 family protein [Arcanobacterium wilhelmae]|uniref:DUF2017 family protein n=1 Tax=Arcanobacterium wilhelmae TaxID=1803177 RepID=UPI00241514A4|nr:DUF2017 family protein [Arcanobacterium wilhelmae]WFN90912.1 DUF2017 family protein [Arcanobacterium wilhelmae]